MSDVRIPETSIVIRAFNEERWLPAVLAALDRQCYRDFEVILVDSGSVDRTRDIAAANGARIVRLRTENFTFGHSLNAGIEVARGTLIAIVSAHAIPADEHWLERLVAPLRNGRTAMVFGGQRGHEISKFSEARDFERIFGNASKRMESPNYFANNANSAIRRDLWSQYKFDEGLPGLEDIGWAMHWMDEDFAVEYVAEACIIHVHTESWKQIRNRYHREGMAARWVQLKILRHIPGEILREAAWLIQDLWLAVSQRRLWSLAREIARFRYEKTVGTVRGIIDSRGFANPARRAELFFNASYRALSIRGPNHAAFEDRSVPSLKPGEVLIRVAYVGICATDLEILEGSLGYYKSGLAKFPIVPGHEFSGTVVSLGPRVTGLAEGDRVVVECIQGCGECQECGRDSAIRCAERREVGVMGHDGAYATYVVTRARYAHRIPANVSLAKAALAEPLAVVLKAVRRLNGASSAPMPRRCAVIGAGTIGHLAARVLSLQGHQVTVFDQEQSRLALLNGSIETGTALRGLDRFDWLIEATGNQAALAALLQESATGATLLLLGLPYANHDFSFESVVGFDRTVIGSVGSSAKDFADALDTLALINTEPFHLATFCLDDYQDAWKAVRARSHVKVMLKVDEPGL
jgi:threonine dehydrogenase-like Zn-dependent dehydrogenase/glycosyltransferase involved in cell wall biosynthesis